MLEFGILVVVVAVLAFAYVANNQKNAAKKRENEVRESLGIIVPDLDKYLETAKTYAEARDAEAYEQECEQRNLLEEARKKAEAAATNRDLAATKRRHIRSVLGQ